MAITMIKGGLFLKVATQLTDNDYKLPLVLIVERISGNKMNA
ncbi:MAG: hypothetical protein V2B19_03385 [Pseudomonadota bacterium]